MDIPNLNEIERRKERLRIAIKMNIAESSEELDSIKKPTLGEWLDSIGRFEIAKQNQHETFIKYIKREYPSAINNTELLFKEYWAEVCTDLVKNMIEFMKSKQTIYPRIIIENDLYKTPL